MSCNLLFCSSLDIAYIYIKYIQNPQFQESKFLLQKLTHTIIVTKCNKYILFVYNLVNFVQVKNFILVQSIKRRNYTRKPNKIGTRTREKTKSFFLHTLHFTNFQSHSALFFCLKYQTNVDKNKYKNSC